MYADIPFPQKITREKILVKDIVHLNSKIDSDINNLVNDLKKGDTLYPWQHLLNSIQQGWDPTFYGVGGHSRRGTYHTDPPGFSPYIVVEYQKNGKTFYSPYCCNHRTACLRYLNPTHVDTFVLREDCFQHITKQQILDFLKVIKKTVGSGQMYESLWLPHDVKFTSRDDTHTLFHQILPPISWSGKTVLEIGCHIAMMRLTAKRYGAKKVVGFDLDPKLIILAKQLSQILELDIEVYQCDFWDFPLWGKEQFDIVMAHQCMYHFTTEHRCKYAKQHTEAEMLNKITNATKDLFWTYTFVRPDNNPSLTEGYRPTKSQIITDLTDRGFKNIEFYPLLESSSKTSVVAWRNYSATTTKLTMPTNQQRQNPIK